MRRSRSLRLLRLALAALVIALALPGSPALAAGVVGAGTAASCTEAAFDAALAGGGLVVFNCGGPVTLLLTAQKAVAIDTQIDGAGLVTLSAAGAGARLFDVLADARLNLRRIALQGGSAGAGSGGAIRNAGATQLDDVTIRDSSADLGGAIATSGPLTLNQVTLSGNTARLGGAIYADAPVAPGAGAPPVQLVNATLSDNTGTNGGGAIYNSLSAIALRSATLVGNSADGGGSAIFNAPPAPGATGTVTVQNSILAAGALGAACQGAIASSGGNIASDASCALGDATDRNATNPVLGPLQQNGGLTATRLPLAGSPALDAGLDASCPALDQRGLPRPFGAGCDIGAAEVQQAYGALAGPWFVTPAGSDANPCNLVAAPCRTIAAAVAKAAPGDAVQVAEGAYSGGSGDEVVRVAKNLTIAGGWNASFSAQTGMSTILGSRTSLVPPRGRRALTIAGGAEVTLTRLVVRDGAPPLGAGGSSYGGGIAVDGTLHATQLDVTGNAADVGGGIYVAHGGAAYIVSSAVHDNLYAITGGGIYAQSATLVVAASTVSSQLRLPSDAADQFQGTEIDVNAGTFSLLASTVVSQIDDELPFGSGGLRFAIRNNAATTLLMRSLLVGRQPCQTALGVTSLGGNVATRSTCALDDATDQVSADVQIGPLQDNGGPTPTHALALTSPAVDTSAACSGFVDQRGVPRPQRGRCDSGAYEYQGVTTTVLALPFTSTTPLGLLSAQRLVTARLAAASAPLPATFEYLPRDNPPVPLPSNRPSLASFEVRVYSGALTQGVAAKTTLLPALGAPMTLTIDVSALPAGVTPASLQLYVYDASAGAWRSVPTTVDAATGTVSAQTIRLGLFALGSGPWSVALPVTMR